MPLFCLEVIYLSESFEANTSLWICVVFLTFTISWAEWLIRVFFFLCEKMCNLERLFSPWPLGQCHLTQPHDILLLRWWGRMSHVCNQADANTMEVTLAFFSQPPQRSGIQFLKPSYIKETWDFTFWRGNWMEIEVRGQDTYWKNRETALWSQMSKSILTATQAQL